MKMKTVFKYILSCIFLLSLSGCSDDIFTNEPFRPSGNEDLNITISFPEMGSAQTRAVGPNIPKLEDLDLYLFVFDDGSLSQTLHLDSNDVTGVNEADGKVTYKVLLPQTTGNAVIHFVALDDGDGSFERKIADVGFGLEDTLMPLLTVGGDSFSNLPDVYWQRVDIGVPIQNKVESEENPDLNRDGTEDIIRSVFAKTVPLVRNFAKIHLSIDSGIQFTVKGWTVVNALNSSSVTPWYSPDGSTDIDFARFADLTSSPYRPLNYDEIVRQGYNGINQTGADLLYPSTYDLDGMAEDEGENWKSINEDFYLYERREVSVNPLYLLIYGYYEGNDGGAWGYYKLNLGHSDSETGLFTPYNVVRNIQYNVIIKSVTAPGYKTPAMAAISPAFNNISADVNTKNMTNISDGIDMLYVNFVNRVVTSPTDTEVTFKYRYVTNVLSPTGRNTHNEMVTINYISPDGEVIGLPDTTDPNYKGEVIESWSTSTQDIPDEKGLLWRHVTIKTHTPTFELKQQSFTIFSKPAPGSNQTMGLSKKMTLILRQPWDFQRMETFPGTWNDDTEFPDYDPDGAGGLGYSPDEEAKYKVGYQKGAPLTVFWELPSGLPEAIFPLDFVIESDRQNIENSSAGNATVEVSPSLFPNVSDTRIKFVKRVRWEEYAPNGETSTPQTRVVRARFVTTTNIESLWDESYITTLKLHNQYFNDTQDKFERSQPSSGPVTMPANKIWNFSVDTGTQNWTNVFNAMGTSGQRYWDRDYTAYSTIDGLKLTQGYNAGTERYYLISGEDANGKYIAASRTTNNFSFSYNVPDRAFVKLVVTASDHNASAAANYRNVNMTTNITPSSLSIFTSDNDVFTTKRDRVFDIVVPAGGANINVTLQPSANYDDSNATRHNALRIYKIGIYIVDSFDDPIPEN